MADDQGLYAKLMQTWPARVAEGLYQGIMAPGNALASTTPITSEQMIAPAMNLAGAVTLGTGAIPAEANTLRAGIRSGYQTAPQNLMGFSKNGPGKAFADQGYKYELPVRVTFKDGDTFDDVVKGVNAPHAYERALRNWPDALHITPNPQ